MLTRLLHTETDFTLAWMRIVAGSVMFAHGAQKMLGWYGGKGYDAALSGFLAMGISEPLAIIAILTEFVGAIDNPADVGVGEHDLEHSTLVSV